MTPTSVSLSRAILLVIWNSCVRAYNFPSYSLEHQERIFNSYSNLPINNEQRLLVRELCLNYKWLECSDSTTSGSRAGDRDSFVQPLYKTASYEYLGESTRRPTSQPHQPLLGKQNARRYDHHQHNLFKMSPNIFQNQLTNNKVPRGFTQYVNKPYFRSAQSSNNNKHFLNFEQNRISNISTKIESYNDVTKSFMKDTEILQVAKPIKKSELKIGRSYVSIEPDKPKTDVTTELEKPKTDMTTDPDKQKTDVTTELEKPKTDMTTEQDKQKTDVTTESNKHKTDVTTEPANPKTDMIIEPDKAKTDVTTDKLKTDVTTEPAKPKTDTFTEPDKAKTDVTIEPDKPKTDVTTEPDKLNTDVTTEPAKPKTDTITEPDKVKTDVTTEQDKVKTDVTTEPDKPETDMTAVSDNPITDITTESDKPKMLAARRIDNNEDSFYNKFTRTLDNFERKFYEATFTRLSSISPVDRRENGISFIQSGLLMYLILTALSVEVDPETKLEIQDCIGINASDTQMLQLINQVMRTLPESNDDLRFRLKSRLVMAANLSYEMRNETASSSQLHLDRFNATDTSEELVKKLNHMVEEDSGGAMHNTFDDSDLMNGVSAMLISTVYLRARWRAAPTLLNGTRPFHDAEGAPKRAVRMLRINDVMRYADLWEWDAEAIEISYATPNLSLVLLVPRGRSLRKLSEHMSKKPIQKIIDMMQTMRLAVTMPIYTLRMNLVLPNKLQFMGLSRLVDTSNDTSNGTLRLSHAIQRLMFWAEAGRNAFKDDGIEWDEHPELELMVDRPYLFFVRWKNHTLINGHFVL